MTPADGFNPLRWDCATRGCFNQKCRPKIEMFAGCFPGRMSFGDVDAMIEVSGNALVLEWKSHAGDLPAGQRILYERITRNSPISVLVVVGDAETMTVEAAAYFFQGERYPPQGFAPASLETITDDISAWADYALRHPALAPRTVATEAGR